MTQKGSGALSNGTVYKCGTVTAVRTVGNCSNGRNPKAEISFNCPLKGSGWTIKNIGTLLMVSAPYPHSVCLNMILRIRMMKFHPE